MTDDTKFDPYASDVQEVKHAPQETPAAKAKRLNRKLALAGVGGVLMVIVLAVIAQSYGADQSQSELLEARRLEAQREPVNLDAEGAEQDAASRIAQKEKQIEEARKKAEADAANAATKEPVAVVVAPSDPQGEETLALARGIASARAQPTGEAPAAAKKPEEVDPWVEAARGFRAQDAQGYYQDRMAARRASQFFGGGTPTASSGGGTQGGGAQGTQGPGASLPPAQDSPEAFVARLQAAQRPAQGGPQAVSSTSLLQPASSASSSEPTVYAALDTGNAHQEAFYHQGGEAQAGYRGGNVGRQGVADVQAGTVVHLVLETGLSSELPGVVIARVARPVYDPSMSRVTIPSGTKVIGTYNARVEKGQTRAQVLWTTLVWSGGGSFDLGGLPGVDLGGQSGVEAQVDNHWDRAFAGAALSGVLSASASALAGPTNQLAIDPRQQAIYGAARPFQEMGEASAKGFLELEPTLTLEPGALAGMLVPHDLLLLK